MSHDHLASVDGFRMWCHPGNYISDILLAGVPFEPWVCRWISALVRETDCCLDIGANIGWHSVRMGSRGNQVICIEPMVPKDILVKNLDQNDIRGYSVYRHVLGDHERDVQCDFEWQWGPKRGSERSPLQMVTLDSMGLKPDFVKCDTDGMEKEIVRGAAATVSAYRPIWVQELSLAERHLLDDGTFARDANPRANLLNWPEVYFFFKERGYVILDTSDVARTASSIDVLWVPKERVEWARGRLS